MNSQCDGDRDSYDAMVLLTGRYDYQDMTPGSTHVIGLMELQGDKTIPLKYDACITYKLLFKISQDSEYCQFLNWFNKQLKSGGAIGWALTGTVCSM